jgi:protein-disulfide isomerase
LSPATPHRPASIPWSPALVALLSGLLVGATACPPPCPPAAGPRATACPGGVQQPPDKTPDCAQACTYFTYCRARRWTAPKHLAKLILACTTQCREVKPDTDGRKIFDGIKSCSVKRSCVELMSCLEALEARLAAEKPRIDPDAVYRVDVASSATRGPADALVTVVMFADHECGFCRRAYKVVLAALGKHPKTLRLVYKHFPLPSHTDGLRSTRAAECVRRLQGLAAFWTFHDKAMAADDLSLKELLVLAKAAGGDPAAVSACVQAKQGHSAIQADVKQGETLGVDGTPTFYINGRRYPGYLTAAELDKAIAEARTRAEAAVRTGIQPAQVYQHLTARGATRLKYLPPKRPAPRPRPRP